MWAKGVPLAVLLTLVVGAFPAGGLGVVETSEGFRVLLGDQNATFEAMDEAPLVNGALAPEEATPVGEGGLEPWRGYERTWLANVSGVGSVLVMGEGTGVVLEAAHDGGDEAGEGGGEASSGSSQGGGGEEGSPDPKEAGGETPVDGSWGGEHVDADPGGSRDVARGIEAVEEASDDEAGVERGSWLLLAGCLVVAGGLGAWEVWQRWRSEEEDSFVVPVPEGEEDAAEGAGGPRSRGRVSPRRRSSRAREVVLMEEGRGRRL